MENSDLLKELRIDRSEAETPSRRPLWIGLSAVAVLAMAGGAWLWFAGNAAVSVHTATAQTIAATGVNTSVLDATGYVTARREATVSAQITGTLTEVLIEEGVHVDAGQVLGRLEDTAQRAALAQTQAQLRSAQANLVQIQGQLAQAKRDQTRQQDLIGRHLTSQQALENAQTQAGVLAAQAQVQAKQIELAQASVQAAQVQLGYCTVRAPFGGVVIAKAAQVGEIVSPFSAGGGFTRTGIGTIVDMDSLEVEVDVNEAYINRVQPSQPVESVLNAYQDWKIPSHVIAIIPTADRAKATVKVRIGLDQKDGRIVPDMGVRVSFLEDKKPVAQAQQQPRGVLVPTTALRKDADKDIVFVLKDGKAQRRAVTLGGSVGESRQVQAGVSNGEAVIVDAPADLKDGAAAKVATP